MDKVNTDILPVDVSEINTSAPGKSQIINILLVDDKREDLLALELVLKKENYNFIKAASGRDALRILLKERNFAIILMDVHMPLLDGIETAKLIRENEKLKHIPIIFLTANEDTHGNIFKGYKTGGVDFMVKPLIPEIIRAKVAVFAELYKKNIELEEQKKNLIALNQELKKQADEIIRSNNELEKFAYVASHDMQEPLRTIISYIQILQNSPDIKCEGDTKLYMEYVINASYRMRELIMGLLEYSRIGRENKSLEKVDCNDVLKEVLANLENSIKENNAVISYDVLPVVNGHYFHMVQLFQNILSNALKFKRADELRIKISYDYKDGLHHFSIKDNGIGIEQKYLNRIFEIFQRLHPINEYAGMGIGLALCKKIVEYYGGTIGVESTPGEGSTFSFIIPDRP